MYADMISGNRHRSGADLERRVKLVSGRLKKMGLSPGSVVCVLMRNDFPFVEVALGAEQAGLAMVPLNWHGSTEEILYIINDCGAKMLFAHADLFENVRDRLPKSLDVIIVDVPPEIVAAYEIPYQSTQVPAGALRYERWLSEPATEREQPLPAPFRLTYTSGSTGHPKGVIRMRGSDEQAARFARTARATHCYTVDSCRAIMTAPLYHSAPLAYGLMYVMHGELLVLQTKFDAAELLHLIKENRLTHLYAVATMFGRLLALSQEERAAFDRSSLKSVVHGAAMCPPAIKRAMIDWWGPIITECYAATETALITVCTSEEWLARPGTVGRAAEGVALRIVDDDGRDLPPGEVGEILIQSDATRLVGYLNRPDAMEELRRGDWVSMGDVGHMDADGFLWITDRKKDLVISGGVNIFPAEVERILITLPQIGDCIVFGVVDEDLGEVLVALVELRDGAVLLEDDVKSALRDRIGRLRVPKVVRFLERLPREDTGKLARRKAKAAYLKTRTR